MQDLALNLDRMVAVMQRQTAQITFFWFHTEQLSPILVWIANAKILPEKRQKPSILFDSADKLAP
jgi:hypothetical protein